jgi:hypothetical protein
MIPGGSNMAVFSMKWCEKKYGSIFDEMMTNRFKHDTGRFKHDAGRFKHGSIFDEMV